jgi:2-dehydropantoate 2-reductase
MSAQEILIVGSGAMASLFAARLAKVRSVNVLGTWREGLEAIARNGVRVLEKDGTESVAHPDVIHAASELSDVQMALVLVKAWQTEKAAQSLEGCLGSDGIALSLQNGLGNLEVLRDILGQERTTLGVTTTGATLLEPGVVRHGGDGPICLGKDQRFDVLHDVFVEAGFEVHRQDDLDGLIWSKLAVNAAINPLTALLEVRNGVLLEQEATRALMVQAAQEVADVASKKGIRLTSKDPATFAIQVAEQTYDNRSSMLQDIQRGAPTEIEAICGAIVRAAERVGIKTPVNWSLWKLVSAKALIETGS